MELEKKKLLEQNQKKIEELMKQKDIEFNEKIDKKNQEKEPLIKIEELKKDEENKRLLEDKKKVKKKKRKSQIKIKKLFLN